jgi:hypothetical protein
MEIIRFFNFPHFRNITASFEVSQTSKSFIYQQMHFLSVLQNVKIYIKIYIKISRTCFDLRPSSGSLNMSLKRTFNTFQDEMWK